ncbi:MAG: class I SAM-dependent methyltransferase [Ramlibacter sp.]|nr:class I SAM-dependent methyltransferase [Ramlibacter sp.]
MKTINGFSHRHAELVPGSVQETMVMCFLDRARYSPMFPTILDDAKAVSILEKFGERLSARSFRDGEMPALSILLRSRYFDDAVRAFVQVHPRATVINLAAGLETNFFRVDNGELRWWDVDLPDAIDFRRQYIQESCRNRFVKADLLDFA